MALSRLLGPLAGGIIRTPGDPDASMHLTCDSAPGVRGVGPDDEQARPQTQFACQTSARRHADVGTGPRPRVGGRRGAGANAQDEERGEEALQGPRQRLCDLPQIRQASQNGEEVVRQPAQALFRGPPHGQRSKARDSMAAAPGMMSSAGVRGSRLRGGCHTLGYPSPPMPRGRAHSRFSQDILARDRSLRPWKARSPEVDAHRSGTQVGP